MDAKITKERLGNFLAYDWIKMLGLAAIAVFVIILLFTTLTTRVTTGQRFSAYGYTNVSAGNDLNQMNDEFARKVFSYEILSAEGESFSTAGDYAGAIYSARRATGDGDVMFMANVFDDKGNSELQDLMRNNGLDVIAPQKFLTDVENYLKPFFTDWESGELDVKKAEQAFRNRNTGDKRFKTDAQIKIGIASEEARLRMLREDLLYVRECMQNGLFSETIVHKAGETEGTLGDPISCGFNLNSQKLSSITNLFYHVVEREDGKTVKTNENLCLIIFDNYGRDGEHKYDIISYLRYLGKTYAKEV